MDISLTSHVLAILGISAFFVVLYNLRKRVKNLSHKKENGLLLPPQVTGALPIIGHLHMLGKEKTPARTFGRLADEYGPIFTFWLGIHRAVIVSSHEAIKECFTTNDKILANRPKSSHGQYLSYNYAAFGFASYGPYWREIRKMVVIQLLSSHRIKSLKHVQVSEVNSLIKNLYLECKKGGNSINISEYFEHLTLNMITRMIAGKRYFNCDNSDDEVEGKRIRVLMKEFMFISGAFLPSDVIPFLWWLNFLGPLKTMKHLSREFNSLMESWIDEHKLKRIKRENIEENFIDVMLSVIEDDLFGHSRENIIKGTVMTLIIAGADTTSISLTWILSNLLNNRRALDLAQEELDRKVGRNRCVLDSDIANLVYLNAIIKETLRLYPPGPLAVPHVATEDCSISGYQIPKGTRVFANVWKLHRDPNVWSNPDRFMPERFLTSETNIDVLGQNFEYIPFGTGRRSCPGIYFAFQAVHLTLARLLQAFSITTPLNAPVDMTEGLGITLPKATPLEIQISPRLSPELYE